MNVEREKYERVKEAGKRWYELLEESKIRLEEQEDVIMELNEQVANLQIEVERWKRLAEDLPDNENIEELEEENKHLKKEIRKIRKESSERQNSLSDKISRLEREKILMEGRLQQIEESRNDLRERYNELRQDLREQQRWSRTNSKKL